VFAVEEQLYDKLLYSELTQILHSVVLCLEAHE